MDFGYALRTMRKAAGISLRQLARQVGVSAAYLSQVERGVLPPPTNARLRDIARVLGVPASYLLALTDRIGPELMAYLGQNADVAAFLSVARKKGLTSEDFLLLATFVEEHGKDRLRELLRSTQPRKRRAAEKSGPLSLLSFIPESCTWHRLSVRNKREALRVMVEGIARSFGGFDTNIVLGRLLRRESEGSTGIGEAIAVPHASCPWLREEVVALATLEKGIDFAAIDEKPVDVIFLLLGPEKSRHDRLKILARIAQLGRRPGFAHWLWEARSRGELRERLRQLDQVVR